MQIRSGLFFTIRRSSSSRMGCRYYFSPATSIMLTISQWATCAFFLTFIALAMADLGSSMPTSGGLYYWTYKYSSPRWRTILCWIVGCESNLVGHRVRKLTTHPPNQIRIPLRTSRAWPLLIGDAQCKLWLLCL